MGKCVTSPLGPNAYKPRVQEPTTHWPSSLTARAPGESTPAPSSGALRNVASASRTDGEFGRPDTICKWLLEENHNIAAEPHGLKTMRSGFAATLTIGVRAPPAGASRTAPELALVTFAKSCAGEAAMSAKSCP